MDHHCPWISNCVGYANQKLFILFLFYGLLYCVFIFSFVSPISISLAYHLDSRIDQTFYFNSLILLIIAAVFGLCFMLFFCVHSFYIFTNQTTIQQLGDIITFKIASIDGREDDVAPVVTKLNIYDVGLKENFIQVFGTNAWLWMIPIPATLPSGFQYPINQKTLSFIFQSQPL